MSKQTPEKELQEFVRIISHDLRGPVGQIKSFQKRLMKNIELTETQSLFKNHLDSAIKQLESQLEGILALSRINTTEVKASPIKVKDLIDEVLVNISKNISPNTKINMSINEDLTIISDRNRLYQAYYEVISNAFKFHLADIEAIVSLEAQIIDNKLILTIIDQGIGIEEKDYQEIFLPFRYLNHQDDFSGLGMGLTLSKKNIQSINGTIEISKNDKQGCRFTITVPVQLS